MLFIYRATLCSSKVNDPSKYNERPFLWNPLGALCNGSRDCEEKLTTCRWSGGENHDVPRTHAPLTSSEGAKPSHGDQVKNPNLILLGIHIHNNRDASSLIANFL